MRIAGLKTWIFRGGAVAAGADCTRHASLVVAGVRIEGALGAGRLGGVGDGSGEMLNAGDDRGETLNAGGGNGETPKAGEEVGGMMGRVVGEMEVADLLR